MEFAAPKALSKKGRNFCSTSQAVSGLLEIVWHMLLALRTLL